MPKEIPILFSTAMVQAILEGRKTETRREVKNHVSEFFTDEENEDCYHAYGVEYRSEDDGKKYTSEWVYKDDDNYIHDDFKCPYGKPGDVLWVRESFRKYYHVDESGFTNFDNEIIDYAADNPEPMLQVDGDGFHMYNKDGSEKYIPFKPSIHMPKAAARIWLEVLEVKVERLQDITEDSARSEGIEQSISGNGRIVYRHYLKDKYGPSPIHSFETLWQSINGAESWKANPWVWVIKFKVLSTTGKPQNLTT